MEIEKFSQQVDYIAHLQDNSQISGKQALQQIDNLWQELKYITR